MLTDYVFSLWQAGGICDVDTVMPQHVCESQGQPSEVSFLAPSYGFQELNSNSQAGLGRKRLYHLSHLASPFLTGLLLRVMSVRYVDALMFFNVSPVLFSISI